jgi:hypothetical protein
MTQTPKHPSTPISAVPVQKIREELPVAKAWVCEAKSATNPDDLFRPPAAECVQLVEAETACLAQPLTPRMRSLCESHDLDLTRSFDFSLPTAYATYIYPAADQGLQPGGNYSLCTEPRPNEYSCKQFTVRRPFLQDAESLPGAVPSVPCRAAGVPAPGSATYTLPCEWGYRRRTGTEPAVAVFGVVDPGLEQYIGLFNSSWLNTNSGYDTQLEFLAPDVALGQLLQKCAEDPACSGARKLLLAQMPHALASQLTGKFPSIFDATISEADYEHDTGAEEQKRIVRDQDPDGRKTGFLLTPRPVYEPANASGDLAHLEPRISFAKITASARSSSGVTNWTLRHEVKVPLTATPTSGPPAYAVTSLAALMGARGTQLREYRPAPAGSPSVSSAASAALKKLRVASPPTGDDLYLNLAVLAMQNHFHTDIAVLQKRDVFETAKWGETAVSAGNLQNALNRIYWKGDLVIRTHVTGAALKSIMKRSGELDALDSDGLSTELEKGQGMVEAGVAADPLSKALFVNGALVDDATLYSVAVSDFLGLGDTGYADLKEATYTERLTNFRGKLDTLSSLVCREIAKGSLSKPSSTSPVCEETLTGANYLDVSSLKPPDLTPGFTTLEHYRDALNFLKRKEAPVRDPDAQGVVQQRPYWSLKLETADLSYAATLIKQPIESRINFSGVSVTQVTASETSTVQFDYRLRFQEDYSHWHWFLLSETKYQRQWKRDTKGSFSYSTSQPLDQLAFEAGINPRLWKRTRPSGLRLLLGARYEQPLRKLDQTSLSGPAGIGPFTGDTAPYRTVYGKAGLRHDFTDTWFEAGFRYGYGYNLLDHYSVGGVDCFPTALGYLTTPQPTVPPDSCFSHLAGVDKSTPAQLFTRDSWQTGLFLNFNIKLPVWSKMKFTFTLANQGTFFLSRSSDRSADTRYQDILTPALQLPLFGKFSLQPKMDIFLFENQVNHWHFRSISPALSLQYQFNLRRGENWKSALINGSTLAPAK